jgi:cytochrome c556
MAVPVILAETLAITELYLLFTRKFDGVVYYLNRSAGLAVGVYFIGIIYYIMTNAVIPITKSGEWRTVIDVIAVGAYLIAGLPLIWIALQEMGFVNKAVDQMGRLKIHAICVALFLVFGHIAMIAGMVDPSILGYTGANEHRKHSEQGSNTSQGVQDIDVDMAQMHQMHMMHSETSMQDNRIAVDFPAPMREHILTNMRDHLLTISQIQEAMGKGQYDKAAQLAEDRLGMNALKLHGAYENSQFMPKGMQEIGSTMHRNASKFAIEVQNTAATSDIKPALIALGNTTQACVACHAGYRLKQD